MVVLISIVYNHCACSCHFHRQASPRESAAKRSREIFFTQTDRLALSSLRKQGSRNVTVLVDFRFRGNDRLCYVIIIERFAVAFDSKTVSLSFLIDFSTSGHFLALRSK